MSIIRFCRNSGSSPIAANSSRSLWMIGSRRAGRRHDAEIKPRELVAIAELGQRRHVGQQRRALLAVDRERGHGAVADEGQPIGEAEEGDRRRAAHHIVDRLGAAAERHLDDVGAGCFGPFVHERDQRDRGRGIAQRPGLCLRQRGEFGERVHVQRRIRHQYLGGEERIGDRREILLRIVGDLLEQELVIGERLGRQDADRVAVVRPPRRRRGRRHSWRRRDGSPPRSAGPSACAPPRRGRA